MRDKDVVDPLKLDIVSSQLQLGSLATIEQEILFVMIQELRRGPMMQRGCRRSAPQNSNLKFHGAKLQLWSYTHTSAWNHEVELTNRRATMNGISFEK